MFACDEAVAERYPNGTRRFAPESSTTTPRHPRGTRVSQDLTG
jgi:hypothetical protein